MDPDYGAGPSHQERKETEGAHESQGTGDHWGSQAAKKLSPPKPVVNGAVQGPMPREEQRVAGANDPFTSISSGLWSGLGATGRFLSNGAVKVGTTLNEAGKQASNQEGFKKAWQTSKSGVNWVGKGVSTVGSGVVTVVGTVGKKAEENVLRPAGAALLPGIINEKTMEQRTATKPFELDGHFLMFFLQACDYLSRVGRHPGVFRVPSMAEAVVNEQHVKSVLTSAAAQESLDVKFFEHRPLVLAMVIASVLDKLTHPLIPSEALDTLLAGSASGGGFDETDMEIMQRKIGDFQSGVTPHLALLKQVLLPIAELTKADCLENAADLTWMFTPHLTRIEASPLVVDVMRPTLVIAIQALAIKLAGAQEGGSQEVDAHGLLADLPEAESLL